VSYAAGTLNSSVLSGTTASTLSFSEWQASYTAVGTATVNQSLMDMHAVCGNDDNSIDYCGTYDSDCTAQIDSVVPTYYPQNARQVYALSGTADPQGNVDGQITFSKDFFNNTGMTSLPCGGMIGLSVTAVGFYSASNMPSNLIDPVDTGYQQVLIEYPSLTVMPLSLEYVSYLQSVCPCANGDLGGQWTLGVSRTLTYCQSGCQPLFAAGIFPGGALGTPGYGTIQLTTNQLRISPTTDQQESGLNQYMENSTTINTLRAQCVNPQPSQTLCGHMELPCHAIQNADGSQPSYASKGVLYATGPQESCEECYYMNTTYYAGETGCEENSPSTFAQVMEFGFYGVPSRSGPQVQYGNNLALTSKKFTVTPLSQQALNELQVLCQCQSVPGTWAIGVPREFNATCPPSECTSTLFRQQIGAGTQYGVFQRLGDNTRFTQLSATESEGYGFNLTMQDYQWVTMDGACNQVLPEEPSGPNPHPSPVRQHSGSKSMSGGDVFILLLFLTVIIYFGGGMAYNFQRSGGFKNGGTPVIPHVQFWRSIPMLVAEGCHFTFTEQCGTKKSGPTYTSFGGPVDKDFGNKTATTEASSPGGYGAL